MIGKIYCVSKNYSFEWYEPGLQSDYHLQAAVCECKVAALLQMHSWTGKKIGYLIVIFGHLT